MRCARAMMIVAILLLAMLGIGLVARYPVLLIGIGILALLAGGKRAYALTAYGTARWARFDDLKSAGMLGGTGLPLGRVGGRRPSFWAALQNLFDRSVPSGEACERFMRSMRKLQAPPAAEVVRLNNVVHTAVFAPTGVGKGVSLVIPYLLTCPDSCVVVDFKGENAKLTADHRRRVFGHKSVILDPFHVVTQDADTFNPLDLIDGQSRTALDEVRALAEALVIRTGQEHEPHWNDNAEMVIGAMIALTVVYAEGADRSLQMVRTLISDPNKFQKAINVMRKAEEWEGMLARLGNQLLSLKDKELASVLTTANRHMRFLDTLAIAASTKASSFDPAELTKGKLTVYLVLPPEHMRTQSALLRMWITALLRAVVRGGLQEQNKTHFVLDEAASLGQMEILEDAVDKFRGYGVRMQFYYQSVGQLKKCWREGQDQTLLSNTSQIYFGTNDNQTAEYVSNRLGEATIVVRSGGSNSGGSRQTTVGSQFSKTTGENQSESSNWQQHGRKLLKLEEVMALPPRVAITFTPGVPPIRTTLLRYYEEIMLGNGPGRWQRRQTLAEVWITSMLMLAMAAFALWAALNPVHE